MFENAACGMVALVIRGIADAVDEVFAGSVEGGHVGRLLTQQMMGVG